MKITLPQRIGQAPIELDSSSRQLMIVGANGAGKTRFARRLAEDLGARAFRISTLRALFDRDYHDEHAGSIDMQYARMAAESGLLRTDLDSQFDRLLALLVNEEMVNLIDYKLRLTTSDASGEGGAAGTEVGGRRAGETGVTGGRGDVGGRGGKRRPALRPTRLDALGRLWHEIFPDSKLLLQGGRLLFSRDRGAADPYGSMKLSEGERAVIFCVGAALVAPKNSVVIVESPEMFLHSSLTNRLWNSIEQLREDCTMVYVTHDLEFVGSRSSGATVWIRRYEPASRSWDYDLLPAQEGLPEEIYMAILGARKPVLFVEGDGINSIDSKLYPLVFPDFTVKSLGGCNRVIEATRAFNGLEGFHHLDSHGIVDRDRRGAKEVAYLRDHKIMVPEVAEIENLLMLEEVVRTVAAHNRRDETAVFNRVKRTIMRLFQGDLKQQALMHTRHLVKTTVEYRIDGRFDNINRLEEHINDLAQAINPRRIYEDFCREFRGYVERQDYEAVLRVYNRKSMIAESRVAELCGLRTNEKGIYLKYILGILKENSAYAARLRSAIRKSLGFAG